MNIVEKNIDFEIIEERDIYKKVFKLKNGNHLLSMSSEPIHFWNEESSGYDEITCQLYNNNFGINSNIGKYNITMPDGTNNKKKITLRLGDHFIEIRYLGMNCDLNIEKCSKEFKTPKIEYINKDDLFSQDIYCNAQSTPILRYCKMENNIDFEYEAMSYGVKNNIVIRKSFDKYEFFFELNVNSLKPQISECEDRIFFLDTANFGNFDQLVFSMLTPVISDFPGSRSNNIKYNLIENGIDNYILKIIVDSTWLNSIERLFPAVASFLWRFNEFTKPPIIHSNIKTDFSGPYVGIKNLSAWQTKISVDTSAIPDHVVIENANITFKEISVKSQNHYVCVLVGDDNSMAINLPKDNRGLFSADVFSNITNSYRNNKSSCNFEICPALVYGIGMSFESPEIGCDKCIKAAKEKLIGNNTPGENGIVEIIPCNVEKTDDEVGSVEFSQLISVTVEYSYPKKYSNHRATILLSDSDHLKTEVKLNTGDLYLECCDYDKKSTGLPISIFHYYNFDCNEYSSFCGNRWGLSVDQKLRFVHSNSIIQYIDCNGKILEFEKNNSIFTCKNNPNIKLKCYGNNVIKIYDAEGNICTYDKEGLITQIENANGKKYIISRNKEKNILNILSDSSDSILFEYSNDKLISISDRKENTINYIYDTSNNLRVIKYHDGSTTEFTYEPSGRLSKVKKRDGSLMIYDYTDDGRIYKVSEFDDELNAAKGIAKKQHTLSYRGRRSISVQNIDGISKVYFFDNSGGLEFSYIDRIKKRSEKSLNSFNYIENGRFDDTSEMPWQLVGTKVTVFDTDGIVGLDNGDNNHAYRIIGIAHTAKYLKQNISLSKRDIKGNVLVLSAWARAESLTLSKSTKFEIRAEVYYDDSDIETFQTSYDHEYTGWQYAALPIRIKKHTDISRITVYLDYSHNNGICLFDDVRLVSASTYE